MIRHLQANRQLHSNALPDGNIFVSKPGQVLELDRDRCALPDRFVWKVLVDGSESVGRRVVLRDGEWLSQDGLIVVVVTIDFNEKLIISRPDVISRGFVYMRESEALIDEVREFSGDVISRELSRRDTVDRIQLKARMRDDLSRFVYNKTKRKQVVIRVIMSF